MKVKQQWGLISEYHGREQQQNQELAKKQQVEKMKYFRKGLDDQIRNKVNVKDIQRQKDLQYQQYLIKKQQLYNQRQQNDRQERNRKRKLIQVHNRSKAMSESQIKYNENGYNLRIGWNSEEEWKGRECVGKQKMVEGLSQQIQFKQQQKIQHKIKDDYLNQQHQKNQNEQFDRHTIIKKKNHPQNQEIYRQVQQIYEQKKQKQQQLDRKYIVEAAQKQERQEFQRSFQAKNKRNNLSRQVIDSLQEQLIIHQHQKHEQKRHNPEESSFLFLENVYRNKYQIHDKKKYYSELKKQAQQQIQRKKRENMMSDQEIKINRNQLNKIVSGKFTKPNYIDRSFGAIGQNPRSTELLKPQNNEMSAMIHSRLEGIKSSNDQYEKEC